MSLRNFKMSLRHISCRSFRAFWRHFKISQCGLSSFECNAKLCINFLNQIVSWTKYFHGHIIFSSVHCPNYLAVTAYFRFYQRNNDIIMIKTWDSINKSKSNWSNGQTKKWRAHRNIYPRARKSPSQGARKALVNIQPGARKASWESAIPLIWASYQASILCREKLL